MDTARRTPGAKALSQRGSAPRATLHQGQPTLGKTQCRPSYTAVQKKSEELVSAAKNIAQFLDRDTSPDFVSNVIGDAFASFQADPTQVDSILKGIEEQKSAYL